MTTIRGCKQKKSIILWDCLAREWENFYHTFKKTIVFFTEKLMLLTIVLLENKQNIWKINDFSENQKI